METKLNLRFLCTLPCTVIVHKWTKELSLCNKLKFPIPISSQPNVVDLMIFQTMNSVRFKYLSLKYQRSTTSGCKAIEITNFELVANTQFFWF